MQKKTGRVILHVDMNSFYASVEMAYNPELKGKPLAIAGNVEERRGIIVTCSYEARAKGVKTTMPLWEARKLCPDLVVMKPNFDRYQKASLAMFDLLRQFTPLVEPVSIDEGYMDITERSVNESPILTAKTIQKQLLHQFDLPCSIGIAPNKFLAKTASDMKKPLGITILRKRDIPDVLWPLSVGEMHGVGTKTKEKLNYLNILTIGDLAKANEIQLKAKLGINGIRLKERAGGIDFREVDPDSISDFKSVGNSTTLPRDVTNVKELNQVLDQLAEKVSMRLRRKQVQAETIGITIRYKDRKTVTRSKKLPSAIAKTEEIAAVSKRLFHVNWTGDAVRLLGITGMDLVHEKEMVKQLDLFSFENDVKEEPLHEALKQLKKKFGDQAIVKASDTLRPKNHGVGADTSFSKDFFQRNLHKDEDT